ncbi:8-oxo-dGDP phosphatase NUDT18-like isoform X2 [Anneissia japonica]|nr:8-oxo-dGDP phosphatase NUDT18-like isoform X2 [Anneissia japonica]
MAMTDIEQTVGELLSGQPPNLPVSKYDIMRKKAGESRPAIMNENLTIIVAAVIFNDNGQVVMVQEAKPGCRRKWYLPAGRVNPNETLEEAVKREVLEESGLMFKPTTIIYIDTSLIWGYWVRVTYTGYITGGHMKTLAEADEESLQAKWCSLEEIKSHEMFTLRGEDIVPIISTAFQFFNNSPATRHAPILPTQHPHKHMCMRIVLIKQRQNNLEVLVCTEDVPHLPVIKDSVMYNDSIWRLDKDAFKSSNIYLSCGVIAVEHCGRPHGVADGVCINFLVTTDTNRELVNKKYSWFPICNPELDMLLRQRLCKTMNVPYVCHS